MRTRKNGWSAPGQNRSRAEAGTASVPGQNNGEWRSRLGGKRELIVMDSYAATRSASVVMALADHPNGEATVRKFAEQRFIRDHGAENVRLGARAKATGLRLQQVQAGKARVDKAIARTPEELPDPAAAPAEPARKLRPAVLALWVVFLILSLAEWWNAARYAVDLTQDWLRAFLFTSALPCVPLAAKYFFDRMDEASRRIAVRWLAGIGGVSALVFLAAFACEFALEPGVPSGTELLGRTDLRALFFSQVLLGLAAGTAIFLWIGKLSGTGLAGTVPNPRYPALEQRQGGLLEALCVETERSGDIEADIATYDADLRVHVETAVALYHQYRKAQGAVEELLESLARLV